MKAIEIPQKYLDLVGTTVSMQGGVFSRKKVLPPTEMQVLEIRQSDATIVNIKEFIATGKSSYQYPTIELLLKNDSMKRAQWSKPMPIREINLNAI